MNEYRALLAPAAFALVLLIVFYFYGKRTRDGMIVQAHKGQDVLGTTVLGDGEQRFLVKEMRGAEPTGKIFYIGFSGRGGYSNHPVGTCVRAKVFEDHNTPEYHPLGDLVLCAGPQPIAFYYTPDESSTARRLARIVTLDHDTYYEVEGKRAFLRLLMVGDPRDAQKSERHVSMELKWQLQRPGSEKWEDLPGHLRAFMPTPDM
jgi:hypothetical protein